MDKQTILLGKGKDRRDRYFVFDINALGDADQLLRIDLGHLLTEDALRISDIRILVWAGLKAGGNNRLTLEEAGELIGHELAEEGKSLNWFTGEILRAVLASGLFAKAGADPNGTAGAAATSASENGSKKPGETDTER